MDFNKFKSLCQKKEVEVCPSQVVGSPLVSVCISTYQHVNYIKKCLDGVLMQKTSFKFEILLGEDNSNDGTREICLEYAKKYPEKIRLFLHDRENNININGNTTGRFNLLYNIFSSKGKYIALCEGDDYWTDPLKLEKQINFLEQNKEYIICGHDRKIVDENGRDIYKSVFKELNDKAMWTQCVVFNKSYLKGEFLEYSCKKIVNWDSFLFLYLEHHGYSKFLNFNGAAYRLLSKSLWSSKSKKQKYLMAVNSYSEMISFFSSKKYRKLKNKVLLNRGNNELKYGYFLRSQGEYRNAIIQLLKFNRNLLRISVFELIKFQNLKINLLYMFKFFYVKDN